VPKETALFATDLHRESDAFHGRPAYYHLRGESDLPQLFAHAKPGQLLGEGSTSSLFSQEAAANLHAHNPGLKVVAMLREPVSMLHALHGQYVNETVEDIEDFAAAIAAEADRRRGDRIPSRVRAPSYLHYTDRARYATHLQRFIDLFGRSQVLVVLHEDFRRDNAAWYRRVLEHIGADPEFVPAFTEIHGTVTARSARLNRLLNGPRLKRALHGVLGPAAYTRLRAGVVRAMMRPDARADVPPSLRATLHDQLRPEVEKVSRMLDRDLVELWDMGGRESRGHASDG